MTATWSISWLTIYTIRPDYLWAGIWDGGRGACNPFPKVQHFHDEALPMEGDVHLKRSDSSSVGVLPLRILTNVKDSGLIGAAQHVEHYEMAGLWLCPYIHPASESNSAARLLEQTLEEDCSCRGRQEFPSLRGALHHVTCRSATCRCCSISVPSSG